MANELHLRLATDLTGAYLANPNTKVSPEHVLDILQRFLRYLKQVENQVQPRPAVPIEDSVHDDYLICLEDGVKVTLLKRYLRTHHNMTPEEYIRKWGLPDDYPMVSKAYSERRSQIAKEHGLGRS